jgi:hypothetical protein
VEDVELTTTRWAKPISKRTPHQRTAHLVITFSNPVAANRAIAGGLVICNKKCHVEKIKREPIRCMKCQRWNHMARDCKERGSTCSNCAGTHMTFACKTPHIKGCISCKSNEHASWSRECPTFLRKVEDFRERNPETALPFFPTEDHWTWSTSSPTNPIPLTRKQTPTGSKPNPLNRQNKGKDKEIDPANTQIYYNGLPDFVNMDLGPEPTRDWWDDAPLTSTNNAGPSGQPASITQITSSGAASTLNV